jgi:RNA polymerase sigma-70 factor (ECF subfamily)
MDAYLRHGPILVRKAERLLRNHDDALDVVHTLFLELLQRDDANFELGYLYRAVNNRCLNILRDRAAQRRLLERQDVSLFAPTRTHWQEHFVDLDLLIKLCRELDAESSELLAYHFVDDMSQDEIAELTGISRKTIGKRLAAVRESVRRLSSQGDAP